VSSTSFCRVAASEWKLARVKGSDFEAIDVSSSMVDSDSGTAVQSLVEGGGADAGGESTGGSTVSGGGGGGGCFIPILRRQ